jgi:CDP-glycerol glycerophosphotransferase (TagB/SpsB family)
VPHGSGDRNVAYHPELAQFDLFLLSGQKLADEMVRHGIARADQCRLIGYPKFDTVDLAERPRVFDNDRPIFVYNPHFDPYLSSWYDQGNAVLEYFRRNPQFNLIFAPHIMLFRKKLHVSLEYRAIRIRPDIDPTYRDCPNILIDTNSIRLSNMSYTRAADVYIGDVSSQVYEFLARPRACFFLDTHSRTRPGDPLPYEFWQNGDVRRTAAELAEILPDWQARAAHYADEQRRLFRYTIDIDAHTPSTLRAAQAITAWLEEKGANSAAEAP